MPEAVGGDMQQLNLLGVQVGLAAWARRKIWARSLGAAARGGPGRVEREAARLGGGPPGVEQRRVRVTALGGFREGPSGIGV